VSRVIIENLNKRFDDVVAVKDFSLAINDGEFIVLVGPSGCGKTTLLRMVAGLESVSSGDIYIDNKRVTHIPPKKRDIAMVFQNYALYPHMNVFNNMAFALKLRKARRNEIDESVKKTACLLGIDNLLSRLPNQLSGGQKQRVALGRASVRQPKVFLVDEPLSNLDAKLRISMRAEILDIHQRLNNTSIYVTHDQLEAMTMGTRIVIMKDGLVLQNGPPKEIYNQPANKFVAGFIGSPAMNFLECKVESDGKGLFASAPNMKLKISDRHLKPLASHIGKTLIVGLRPEHFRDLSTEQNQNVSSALIATVRLVEPLGSEQLIHVDQGVNRCIARINPKTDIRLGQSLRLEADMESATFFNRETEERIA